MTATEEASVSQDRPARRIPVWIELPLVVVIAILLAFLVKSFLIQIFYIPSGSMEDTLLVGDRVAVNRLAYRIGEPKRGDVIVFDGVDSFVPAQQATESQNPVSALFTELGRTIGVVPPPDTVFVKRVIGVGGDRVACCDNKGRLTVNGGSIDEPYLFPGDEPSSEAFSVKVPQGKLWVMGDHRSASADSRAHMGEPGGGFVPVDRALGRAFAVIWPQSQWSSLPEPAWAEKLNAAQPAAVGSR